MPENNSDDQMVGSKRVRFATNDSIRNKKIKLDQTEVVLDLSTKSKSCFQASTITGSLPIYTIASQSLDLKRSSIVNTILARPIMSLTKISSEKE
jgi:hypothetical protein